MSTIVTRAGKGSPLTNAEVDSNFSNLNTDKLELGGTFSSGTANSILFLNGSKVLTTGSALTFDGTTQNSPIYQATSGAPGFSISNQATGPARSQYVNNGGTFYFGLDSSVGGLSTAYAVNYWYTGNYPHVWAVNNSEQMRLTSTGLGIGTSSPSNPLHINAAAGSSIARWSDSTNGVLGFLGSASALFTGSPSNSFAIRAENGLRLSGGGNVLQATLDASGNLGLGVTPSASNLPTIESEYGLISGKDEVNIIQSAYYNSGFKYSKAEAAGRYLINSGIHSWFTAPSGTAGNAISFTQAMTLDASGNLGVGETSPALTLHVKSAAAAIGYFETSNTGTGPYVIWRNGTTSIGDVGSGKGISGSGNATDFMIASRSTYPLLLGTGSTERARITSGGTFQTQLDAEIYGITVGRGAGAVATNTAVGAGALFANTTGVQNTALGSNTLFGNTSGGYNTAVGYQALTSNLTASYNTAVGWQSLYSNTTGRNTAFGIRSLYLNVDGTENTATGDNALYSNVSGNSNTALGYFALFSNTASNNLGVGTNALYANTTGSGNTAVGKDAGYAATTGINNVWVGYRSGESATTAFSNTAVGVGSLGLSGALGAGSFTGQNNVAVGASAGRVMTSGSYNTAVGSGVDGISAAALQSNTSGWYNTAIGNGSLGSNTTASYNSALGTQALHLNTTGAYNTAVGMQSLYSNTTASNNTAVGYQAGYSNTTGTDNISIGRLAGYGTTTTSNNIAIGYNTLSQGAGSANNVVIGHEAQRYVGSAVVAIGYQALSSSTGSNNTAVGYQAGYSNTTGTQNLFLGYAAGYSNTTGTYNTAAGHQAGLNITTGTNNAFFGRGAGYTVGGSSSNNTAIGDAAMYYSTGASDNTAIGQFALAYSTGASNTAIGSNAGNAITTGAKNTILGRYNGNQGGLDIRTANNYIVLSDGDGNPRLVGNGSGNFGIGEQASNWSTFAQILEAPAWALASFASGSNIQAHWFSNSYQGVSGPVYKYSGAASRVYQYDGGVYIESASSGTAGNAITWTGVFQVSKDKTVALQGAAQQSGTGITFPATQNASSNANTLDDYEEGTWTPTTSAGGVTLTNLNSYYTKIGRLVHVYAYVEVNNSGGTLSGITWTGLPFAALSYAPALRYYKAGTGSANTQIWASDSYTESGAAQIVDNNDIGSGISQIMISATYFVS